MNREKITIGVVFLKLKKLELVPKKCFSFLKKNSEFKKKMSSSILSQYQQQFNNQHRESNHFVFCSSTCSPLLISHLTRDGNLFHKLKSTTGESSSVVFIERVDQIAIVVSFLLSVLTRHQSSNGIKISFCDLRYFSAASPSTSTNDFLLSSLRNEIQQILLSFDPIFSPTISNANSPTDSNSISEIVVSDEFLSSLNAHEENSSFRQNVETFLIKNVLKQQHQNKSCIDVSVNCVDGMRSHQEILQVEKRFEDFVHEFSVKKKEERKKKNNDWFTAQTTQERKWSIWMAQKMIASENTENLSEASKKLESLFERKQSTIITSTSNSHSRYEKILRECTNSILERRGISSPSSAAANHATSPIRKIVAYFSPSGNNKRLRQEESKNIHDQNERSGSGVAFNDDDDEDDETQAILRALTEKKKSMTLAKRAEEWFAELSSRGVIAPFKALAMVIPYHWRFWLTPMGFLVIGTSFMMIFGVVLLFL
jgi:hypothetical protein